MKVNQQNIPLNILLADDDTDDRFFFEKALKEISIATHLTTVEDGEQLMDWLAENSDHLPDILFLDLSMPRKTGFECLTEITENEKLKDIPVVVFSTSFQRDINYENGLSKMLVDIGAQNFVRKPGNFEQLKEVIHQALIRVTEKANKD